MAIDDEKAQAGERTAAEAGWHISRYNIRATDPNTGRPVIFNTRTRACIECTRFDLYAMGALDEMPEHNPFIERLAKLGLIANFDERASLEAEGRLACAAPCGGAVQITICPTMACNFECPYCFSHHGRGKMSEQVQGEIVMLAKRMLDASRAGKLVVTWFGGEPLLACDVIESLSAQLIELTEKRSCEYRSWIFTNGYLITPDVVDLFGRCRIEHVHIPLDGIGAVNDATRRLIGGGPTFERIMENLGLLKPPIQTLVRANTHAGNVSQLDELKALVMHRAEEASVNTSFYAADIIDVGPRDEPDGPMADWAYRGIEVSLRPEARHVPVGKDHTCVGQNLWMVAIDDEGYLYKCGGKLCGQPEFSYGTARDWDPANPLGTASNPDMLSRFLNTCTPSPGDACYDCAWLPLCGGGCPQLRLFGKHGCPPYRYDPDAFVLAMRDRKRHG
ncbi:MAG: radical SAM protein [Atopobiaceae bacterium]|nr:radical SAM protein [Atopobiaceae bacterium]